MTVVRPANLSSTSSPLFLRRRRTPPKEEWRGSREEERDKRKETKARMERLAGRTTVMSTRRSKCGVERSGLLPKGLSRGVRSATRAFSRSSVGAPLISSSSKKRSAPYTREVSRSAILEGPAEVTEVEEDVSAVKTA